MKQDFNESFLRKFDPDMSFFWKWVPSCGKSGGILCGVRQETLEVSAVKTGKYLLQFNLWDKKKKCRWTLITVYGSAHEEQKEDFLAELSAWCNGITKPYIVG